MARSGSIASAPFKKNSIAGVLITQDFDGISANNTIETCGETDEKNSRIYGKNRCLPSGQDKKFTHTKPYDKIVIGYTSEALPFQIVVKGAFGSADVTIRDFIHNHLIPLINDYAEKLSQSQNSERTLKNLIKAIYCLRAQYASHLKPCEFTMSLGITFEQHGQLYCASIGVGDTHLMVRRAYNEVVPLTCKTSINDFHDGFDAHSFNNTGIKRVTNRNSSLIVPVQPGDEIVGCTYLLKELLHKTELFNEHYQKCKPNGRIVDINDKVVKYVLAANKLNNNHSLFDAIKEANKVKFGRHYAIGGVSVPQPALRDTLKRLLYFNELVRFTDLMTDIPKTYHYLRSEADQIYSILPHLVLSVDYPVLTRYVLAMNRVLLDPTPLNIQTLLKQADDAKDKTFHWQRLSELMLSFHPLYAIFLKMYLKEEEHILNLSTLYHDKKYKFTLEDVPILSQFIRKHPKITQLNLSHNCINDETAVALAHALNETKIESLILKDNKIDDEGAMAFNNLKLIKLDLSRNYLTPASISTLAQHPTLKELYLNHNAIGDQAMTAFRHSKLTTLSLKGNKIGDEGVKMLAQASLQTLILSRNKIGDEGALVLQHSTVQNLDLKENDIGDEGAKALAKCKNLNWLFLQNNYVGKEGEAAIKANKAVTYYRTKPNKLSAKDIKQLQSMHSKKHILKGILLAVGVSIAVAAIIALIVFSPPLSTFIPLFGYLTPAAPIITKALVSASLAIGNGLIGAAANLTAAITGMTATTIATSSTVLATGATVLGLAAATVNTALGGFLGFIYNKFKKAPEFPLIRKGSDIKKDEKNRKSKFVPPLEQNEKNLSNTLVPPLFPLQPTSKEMHDVPTKRGMWNR